MNKLLHANVPQSGRRCRVAGATIILAAVLLAASCRQEAESRHSDDVKEETKAVTKAEEGPPVEFNLPLDDAKRYRHLHITAPDQPDVYFWWDGVPASIRGQRLPPPISNVRREDYAGVESCKKCHEEEFESWSNHPHRRMNALATEENVVGDFSGEATIDYLGGRGRFYRENGQFRMQLTRDGRTRTYAIRRTLGSRFFQYYIGRQVAGPDSRQHQIWHVDNVLPFGYWIDHKMWVPIVHVGPPEAPDGERPDPFAQPPDAPYDALCSACHTTLPAGDRMLCNAGIADYIPRSLSIFASAHLAQAHPELFDPKIPVERTPGEKIEKILIAGENGILHEKNTVALGITCEACHNGTREHVADKWNLPRFFPSGENMYSTGRNEEEVWGRTSENLNWTCARCHVGPRPTYAGGMHVWNSTEFTDAANGHCYSAADAREKSMKQLTCVACHNPHEATGPRWTATTRQDDAKCTQCHQQFKEPEAHFAHSHHAEGVGCMDCHMPRINEGLQDLVRTHRIFSPTDRTMIEANQPNACNLCHLDKTIDWTIGYLDQWYKDPHLPQETPTYSEAALERSYPRREGPVGLGWLYSGHESTRLAGAAAMLRSDARWALPQLIGMLDDPYLINRQFTQRGLEEMLDIRLEDYGYRFYMTPQERAAPMARLRAAIPAGKPAEAAPRQSK